MGSAEWLTDRAMRAAHQYLRGMSNSSEHPDVHLLPGKEKPIRQGHPWVFSGAIARIEVDNTPPAAGDWVRVLDAKGRFLGWGHWGDGSIAVRILERKETPLPPDARWWANHLSRCLDVRKATGLWNGGEDDRGFRAVHGEGDGLSGLVVDVYAGVAVIQTHSLGMHRALHDIADGLRAAMGESLQGIVNKSGNLLQKLEGHDGQHEDGWIWSKGDIASPHIFQEHGIRYEVDPIQGQKTGFFLDQRDNRGLLMTMVNGQNVLNAFSYTGGFSMAALKGGSAGVISLDASQSAVDAAHRHAESNGFGDRHVAICGDVMDHLRQAEVLPSVVILDPPAYAKSRKARHKAVQGYKRLNETALRKMPGNSVLWTFSCSQVVDARLFEDTVVAAALASGRQVRILRRLGQPADHPTQAGHGEARYLKGLILHVA